MTRLPILLVLLPSVAAAVPLELTHSARMLDGNGLPLQGAHSVQIALYDAAANGTMRWSEDQAVMLEDGYITVNLGADDSNPLDASDLAGSVWLGISIDGAAELSPRNALVSVPFAIHAETAVQADSATTAAHADSASAVDGGAVDTSNLDVGGVDFVQTGGTVNPDFLPVGTGANDVAAGDHTHADLTEGIGISVSGTEVSINAQWWEYQKRFERYHEVCASLAGTSYANVAAVTPGDSTVNMTGTQVCNNYVGNNNRANWTCISVPYVYGYHYNRAATGRYMGTDVRPTWSSCSSTRGTTDGYPWVDPVALTGTMMACCVK